MATLIELKIHKRFSDLHRKLTKEEYKQLEANIVAEGGCHNPIIVWRDFILDGHNRYEICRKHDISFHVDRFEDDHFDGEQQACGWILRDQLGRRNLTESEASYTRGKLLELVSACPGTRSDKPTSGQNDQRLKTDAAKEIAKQSGVSVETVRRDEKRAKQLDKLAAPIKQAHLEGTRKLTDKELKALSEKPKSEQTAIVREARTSDSSVAVVLGLKPKTQEAVDTGEDSAAAEDAMDAGKPVEKEDVAKQRAKTVKTVEALQRAFDDLNGMKPLPIYKEVVPRVKSLLAIARDWK